MIDMYTLMYIKLMPNKNLQYKKTKQNKTKQKMPKIKKSPLHLYSSTSILQAQLGPK